jgi:hypothetical protein
VRRIATALGLALSLLGCGSVAPTFRTAPPVEPVRSAPPGEPVELLTGPLPFDEDECTPHTNVGELLVDPQFGTAQGMYGGGRDPIGSYPVMWRPGFTGRRVGSEVVVVDPSGNLVATTGEWYELVSQILFTAPEGVKVDTGRFRRGWVRSLIDQDMIYVCGSVRPALIPEVLP